ncbi:tetratricopeptide repeat protein [Vicingaceae bacterium]|nr:tetratricopeptide repeat protein [Vicingaceae bacterium]
MKANKLSIFVLFTFCLFLYSNTLQHEYVLDDYIAIKDNFVVKKGLEGIPTIWETHYHYGIGYQQATIFRPLSLTLFALQWELAPDQPQLAHLVNILLYGILSILIFSLLIQLFGQSNWLLAFLTSLLFIAHPIHTEVVANIKSADDLIVFNLCIGAYLLLIKYLFNQKNRYFILSIVLIGISFFAKESTLTLVLTIPLMLVLLLGLPWKRAIKLSSLYLIPTVVYIIARTKVIGEYNNSEIAGLDNVLVTAPNFIVKLSTALKIMGLYIYKLVIPHPLMNDYSMSQIELNGLANPFSWISLLLYAGLIFLVIKCWKTNKILAFGILFFLVNFSLYSNLFLTIGTAFGERLLFIPSLGFSICCAYFLIRLFSKSSAPYTLKNQSKLILISTVILALYAFKTVNRNKDWKDNFTIYSTDVENCSNSARCQYHHGLAVMKTQALSAKTQNEKIRYLQKAVIAFEKAIAIHPNYSEAYADVGLAYFRMNDFKSAEKNYLKATQLNPSNATAYSNLGSLYFNTQRYQQAKSSYERTLQINPNHIDGLANYASALGTLGDFEGAIRYFKKAITLNPNEPNYYKMVGMTYQNMGRAADAQVYFLQAKRLQN